MAEKKETKLAVELKGVKAKLQTARVALQKKDLKKSGKNKFAGFDYFELADFLPSVNEIFANLGLYSEFSIVPTTVEYEETNLDGTITKKPIIREMAILTIYDVQSENDSVQFEMEVAPVMIGNNSKQNMYQAAGGRNTYYKRYLYMNALEIVEYDECDAVLGQEKVNYQQPTYVAPQPVPVAQNVTVSTPAPKPINESVYVTKEQVNNVENVIQDAVNQVINDELPLSVESKTEIMNLVNEKGLNGADIIMNFCKNNGLEGPGDLLEKHKEQLLEIIGV